MAKQKTKPKAVKKTASSKKTKGQKKPTSKKKAVAKPAKKDKADDGKFTKGRKKTGGREKGVSNKVNRDLREKLAAAMAGHVDSLPDYIDSIRYPEDKVGAIAKVLPYIMPRLNTVDLKIADDVGPRTITITPVEKIKP